MAAPKFLALRGGADLHPGQAGPWPVTPALNSAPSKAMPRLSETCATPGH